MDSQINAPKIPSVFRNVIWLSLVAFFFPVQPGIKKQEKNIKLAFNDNILYIK